MATRSADLLDVLECVICNEDLLDPRPLPCGHSYCGLPRPCLTSLQNENSGLRCAVCRADHNVKAEDIKPLYGIRDYFQGSSNAEVKNSYRFPCSVHPNKDFTFWCTNCNEMICIDCIEEQHDEHPVRNLKKYFIGKIEAKLAKPFNEGIVEYKKKILNKQFSPQHQSWNVADWKPKLSKGSLHTFLIKISSWISIMKSQEALFLV